MMIDIEGALVRAIAPSDLADAIVGDMYASVTVTMLAIGNAATSSSGRLPLNKASAQIAQLRAMMPTQPPQADARSGSFLHHVRCYPMTSSKSLVVCSHCGPVIASRQAAFGTAPSDKKAQHGESER